MFKKMKIIFTCKEDPAFKKGDISFSREGFKFEVRRQLSGAFEYGDNSAHAIRILEHPEYDERRYDTRYDGIPTERTEWEKFWKEWLEEKYEIAIEPEEGSYKEEEI
jgi:hypothetical protein